MKIMQVIPYFCFGGAETMCESLTYELKKLGHQVCVACLLPERTLISHRMEAAGVRILYLDKKLGLDLSMIPKLVKLMKQEKPDVVHTHLNVIKYAAPAAKLAGVPTCVHTVHNVAQEEAEGRLQKITNRIFFRRGWAVPVALSPKVQNSIQDFYGMNAEQIPMIYNGIDLERCRVKENYASEELRLIHIGRFNTQKNHRGLLDAFALIQKKLPGCRLELLGDGELREEMEAYARELGISDQVYFLGNQPDVYPYLQDADVFLLPSKFEGMPMTIIEAMGTGLPVVAAAVGGVPDMFTDGESGFLVSKEPEKVAEAVLRLAESEALRAGMGQKAREESVRFSAAYMAKCYCDVYEKGGKGL